METLFWGVISDFSQYHPISMFMSFSTVPHMFPISIVAHRFLDGIWSNHHGTWWQIPTQQLQSIDPLWVLVVTPPYFTVEVRMEKPVGLHGSRLRPIPGEKVKLGSRTRKYKKLTVNHLHGSSLKEHVQHGSWKTETKNAYVEVT